MHRETYHVPPAVLEACARAERVVAVGTTTVRALESAAIHGPEGSTDLFIRPGHRFAGRRRAPHQLPPAPVDPAGAGRGVRRGPLAGALRTRPRPGYRFLSLGDAMLLRSDAVRPTSRSRPPSGAARAADDHHGPRDHPDAVLHAGGHAGRGARPVDRRSRALGAEVVLANTYHLMLRPGAERGRRGSAGSTGSWAGAATCSRTRAATRSSRWSPWSTTTA